MLLACKYCTDILKTNYLPKNTVVSIGLCGLKGHMLSSPKEMFCCILDPADMPVLPFELLSYAHSHSDHVFWETQERTTMAWSCYLLPATNLALCCWWFGLAVPVGEVSKPTLQLVLCHRTHTDTSPRLARCNGVCGQHLCR